MREIQFCSRPREWTDNSHKIKMCVAFTYYIKITLGMNVAACPLI